MYSGVPTEQEMDDFEFRYGLQFVELFGSLIELPSHMVPEISLRPNFAIDDQWAATHACVRSLISSPFLEATDSDVEDP